MKKSFARLTLVGLVTSALLAGVGGTANAAPCTASNIKPSSAYNVNCSYVQHYKVLTTGVIKKGTVASPTQTSWSNSYSNESGQYGVYKGVLVNYV